MSEDPETGRRIVSTLNPRGRHWRFPGEPPGIRVLLGWTLDTRVVDGGVPRSVVGILTRVLCRCARLTFYWQSERKRRLSEQWKPQGKGWVRCLKPRSLWDVIRGRPTYSLLTTNHPEQASDLFDTGWTLEGQRVFLTPTDVFPALEYHQVNRVFRWSPRLTEALPLVAAEHLAGTNVCGLLLPLADGDFAELILFEEARWPIFEQALAHECATAGVDFQLVDEPTFDQTEWRVPGGFGVGE